MDQNSYGAPIQASDAPNEYLARVDRLFLIVLWLLFTLSLGLSPMYDTWALALMIGLPLALIPTLFILASPGAFHTRLSVAAALMAMCALHIHQSMGVTELHFGIFVALAFLLCYRDWRVIVAAALIVAMHHLSFNYLQQWGYGFICFSEPSLNRVLIHAAYVVVEAGVLSYLAILMRGESAKAGISNALIRDNLDTIRDVNARVQAGMGAIVDASSNIASGSRELSARAQEQSLVLQKTSASIQAFAAGIRSTTENAQQTNTLASGASAAASQGSDVVSRAVETMTSVESRSRQIIEIVALIDDIAFQTNILALNAGVEAARAGDRGSGFAVVASEVRSLAQRCANAAKDIKEMIDSTVQELGSGALLVQEAGVAMARIMSSIDQVVAYIAEIADATKGQTEDIEDIRAVVVNMDAFTAKNLELVQAFSNAAQYSHANARAVLETMQKLQRPG